MFAMLAPLREVRAIADIAAINWWVDADGVKRDLDTWEVLDAEAGDNHGEDD